MQMSWHAMLCHGFQFIQSLSFKTLKAMFSSVIVCWGLNLQLLTLPLFPSTPSCPWIPHHQTISHHSTVVICHFLTNLYLTHFKLTEPTVSQIASYASDGEVSWILSSNCPLLQVFVSLPVVCERELCDFCGTVPSGLNNHCKWSLIARQECTENTIYDHWEEQGGPYERVGERVSNSWYRYLSLTIVCNIAHFYVNRTCCFWQLRFIFK